MGDDLCPARLGVPHETWQSPFGVLGIVPDSRKTMTTSRKQPGVAFWATVVVVVVVVYLLSIGPACWLTSRLDAGVEFVSIVYRPITLFFVGSDHGVSPVGTAIRWYSCIGAAPGWGWYRENAYSDAWEWSYSVWYDPRAIIY